MNYDTDLLCFITKKYLGISTME